MANDEVIKKTRTLDVAFAKELVADGFTNALIVQQPLAIRTVDRLRRVHPDKSPEELIKFLNNTYLGTVTATGTAAGAAAVIPNGVVQVPVAAADLVAFLEASVLYVLAVAEVYGVDVEDIERRKFLLTTVLLGDSGAKAVTQSLGKRTVPYWSKSIINSIPMKSINAANKVLGPRFITKYGTKQGVLVLGKQLPLALGVVVGAGGNVVFGYGIVKSTRKLLRAAPENWEHLDSNGRESVNVDVIEGEENATEEHVSIEL